MIRVKQTKMKTVEFKAPFVVEPINRGYLVKDSNGLEVGRIVKEQDAHDFANLLNEKEADNLLEVHKSKAYMKKFKEKHFKNKQ